MGWSDRFLPGKKPEKHGKIEAIDGKRLQKTMENLPFFSGKTHYHLAMASIAMFQITRGLSHQIPLKSVPMVFLSNAWVVKKSDLPEKWSPFTPCYSLPSASCSNKRKLKKLIYIYIYTE